jgi:hypothetical protein
MVPWMKIIEGAKKATGATMGIGQAIAGRKQRKRADALIPGENPMERAVLSSLQRRRDMLATGTANNSDRVAARQMAKTMANSQFKTGGMANTGVMSSAISQALGNINAANAQQMQAYDQMGAEQSNLISQAARETGMYRSQVMSARAEQNMSAARDNISATFATNGGGDGGGGGGFGGGGGKKGGKKGGNFDKLKGVIGGAK